MEPLYSLLRSAGEGKLPVCDGCPWSPKKLGSVAFGVSCREHGVHHGAASGALSVQVSQDPAGTTPEETGRLCAVCNSGNPTDRTARNGLALWEAAVARGTHDGAAYLRGHYWTNAVMHGAPNGTPARKEKRRARERCSEILRAQLLLLRPEVVIACGVDASESLHGIGLIGRRWAKLRRHLVTGAYRENSSYLGFETSVYCTYHTGWRAVNLAASRLYSPGTEVLLDRRLGNLEAPAAARAFLNTNPEDSASGRGMRVLLLHWLDIGEAIRSAHRDRG